MRILVWSQRGLNTAPSRCVGYEFEDVVAKIECGTEVVTPRPVLGRQWPLVERVDNRFARHLGVRLPDRLRYGKTPIESEYDLFFANFQFLSDLGSLRALPRWQTLARKSVCVIEEVWTRDLAVWKRLPQLVHGFDHVFLECSGTVDVFQERTGIPCSFLPPGIDALRFCPFPASVPRVVDVCHLGRREPATHVPLLNAHMRGDIFYEFDSIQPEHVWDIEEHRDHLAGTLKRSRYVLVNPGKFNRESETGGQQELGFRFFEGAAAGAVMLGRPPRIPAFEENFDWTDAVIEVDPARLLDEMKRLDGDPERLDSISRRNATNSLLRHDWVYRWERILDAAVLPVSSSVEARKHELADLASATL
jgi:hypothetical protein